MTKLSFFIGCVCMMMNTCFTPTSSSSKQNEMKDSLEQELIELGYQKLFLSSGDEDLKRIWKDGVNKEKLSSIIATKTSLLEGKFLAAEVLYFFGHIPNKKDFATLADAYVFALENTTYDKNNTVRLNGNLWGFLYEQDDVGELGKHLLEYGTASIEPLRKLLGDDNNLLYEGSQEAMIGNGYEYRIKDFAAFYLHKITNIPIQFYQDLDKRDEELKNFKERLNKYQNG